MADEKSSPLSEALRTQIIEIVSKGDDKRGGILTSEVLAKVVRVAKTGRDLLVSLDSSNLANLVQRPNQNQIGFPLYGPAVPSLDADMGDSMMGSGIGMASSPYAPAAPVENFGMTAIREIVAMAKNLNGNGSSPLKLVEALAIAREKGLDDVARELEDQLGMRKPLPKLETTVSAGDGVTKITVEKK
jgi:hypothetical protein